MKATAVLEQWRYKVPFRIARGAFVEQHLLLCRYEDAGIVAQAEAEAAAKQFNCKGAHKMGEMWMPCASHGAATGSHSGHVAH